MQRQLVTNSVTIIKMYINRDDWIRTSDPFVPNEVRYQAALHPATIDLRAF